MKGARMGVGISRQVMGVRSVSNVLLAILQGVGSKGINAPYVELENTINLVYL